MKTPIKLHCKQKLILHLSGSLFFIDTKIECTNTAFHWSCPGGYLQVHSALWTYYKIDGCIQTTSGSYPPTNVIKNVQNECENKTSCNFNVADFGVSCAGCSALIYVYNCVSNSLVLRNK